MDDSPKRMKLRGLPSSPRKEDRQAAGDLNKDIRALLRDLNENHKLLRQEVSRLILSTDDLAAIGQQLHTVQAQLLAALTENSANQMKMMAEVSNLVQKIAEKVE